MFNWMLSVLSCQTCYPRALRHSGNWMSQYNTSSNSRTRTHCWKHRKVTTDLYWLCILEKTLCFVGVFKVMCLPQSTAVSIEQYLYSWSIDIYKHWWHCTVFYTICKAIKCSAVALLNSCLYTWRDVLLFCFHQLGHQRPSQTGFNVCLMWQPEWSVVRASLIAACPLQTASLRVTSVGHSSVCPV